MSEFIFISLYFQSSFQEFILSEFLFKSLYYQNSFFKSLYCQSLFSRVCIVRVPFSRVCIIKIHFSRVCIVRVYFQEFVLSELSELGGDPYSQSLLKVTKVKVSKIKVLDIKLEFLKLKCPIYNYYYIFLRFCLIHFFVRIGFEFNSNHSPVSTKRLYCSNLFTV